jgi:hypothetical protein
MSPEVHDPDGPMGLRPVDPRTEPSQSSRFLGRSGESDPLPSRFSGRIGKLSPEDLLLPAADEDHPRAGLRVRRRRRLHALAAMHGGCFTIDDTRQAGYDRRARYHHLQYGNWRRTSAPGVYRLAGWPVDHFEDAHAWLLWAGPDAALTSWSALMVHPSEAVKATPDPEAEAARMVHLVGPDVRTRRIPDRTTGVGTTHVRLHHRWLPDTSSLRIRDLSVRPLDEALCIAVWSSSGQDAARAAELTDRLLDEDLIDLDELLHTAQRLRVSTMLDLLWPRLRPARKDAG